MRVFQHIGHGVLGVSHEHHRCAGFMRPFATIKRLVGQVVLHGIYQHCIHVAAFLLFELVPCHHVPVAHQSQYFLVALHLDKQTRRGHIASADQHAVGRQFLEHVALARAFGSQLHEVVIVLYMRKQSGQRDELLASVHHIRIQADRVHQEVQPFLRGEFGTLFDVFLQVDVGNLYGFQVLYLPTHLDVLSRHIADGDNAPHAVARQQFGILADIFRPDGHSRQAEIGKGGVVLVAPLIEGDGHLVYHPMLAVLADDAFDAFRLRTMHVIVPDYLLDFFQSVVDDFLVITGAILSQQILQHVGGHRQPAFHEESQVLPHHLADEGI